MPRTPKKLTSTMSPRRSPRLQATPTDQNKNTRTKHQDNIQPDAGSPTTENKSTLFQTDPGKPHNTQNTHEDINDLVDTDDSDGRDNSDDSMSENSQDNDSSDSEGEDQDLESTNGNSDEESEEEEQNPIKETHKGSKSNPIEAQGDATDDESEREWTDDENIATAEDTANATKKGQIRFAGYSEAAHRGRNKSVTEVQYQQRRLAIMVNIPEVDNNIDRLAHLVKEVNKLLKFARKNNSKFRLRPFDENKNPKGQDKTKWRTRMIDNDSADFRSYCQGYFPFTPPRGGTYRLRINAVFDKKVSLNTLIENVTHDWGNQDGRSISDIKSQMVYDPVKIGYFMRATRYLTHSYELVDAMEWQATQEGHKEVKFGISWGTIPSPVGGYDKNTAVQAVIIETNKETQPTAVELLKKWYPLNPKKKANPPYPGNFRFVINKDHPSVRGNTIAISNLSVLMERQGIFNLDTKAEQTYSIKALDVSLPGSNLSLRHRLLQIKSKTSGKEWLDKNLFLSVSKSINSRTGQKSSWFTFHKSVAAEATSIVKNLPLFIKTEWEVDPEDYCFAQFLNDRDEWDIKHRVANNEDTDEIAKATKEYTMDLHREKEHHDQLPETDEQSMSSKAAREMKRMMGEDNETVASISQERQRKMNKSSHTPQDLKIDASKSVGSMSGISATSSKTSIVRAKLQKEYSQKFEAQNTQIEQLLEDNRVQTLRAAALQTQMNEMTALLRTLKTQSFTPNHQSDSAQDERSQNSGEPTGSVNSTTLQDDNNNMDTLGHGQNIEHSTTSSVDESKAERSTRNPINPDYNSDEDFANDEEKEYLVFKDQQDQKEAQAIAQGKQYTREEWYGSTPVNQPLPSSDEDEIQTTRKSRMKRLIMTESDDIDPKLNSEYFKSTRSDRQKKRSNASGSIDSGEDD